jgi:phosphohistidine phosphatase SixA
MRHGQAVDMAAVADWTRPWIGHGLAVAAEVGAAICPDSLRFLRDRVADTESSF